LPIVALRAASFLDACINKNQAGSGTILILITLIGILRVLLPLHFLLSIREWQLSNCAFVRTALTGIVCPVQIPAVFVLSNHQ
jgi:hypothetical protein